MEENKNMTNDQTRALLKSLSIINQILKDPEEFDKRLKEISETLEKGATEADQANR